VTDPIDDSHRWYLEGQLEADGKATRILLAPMPCRVGRNLGLPIALPFASVSSEHAEFSLEGDGLSVQDLGSTNGSFLNRERITGLTHVRDGDVVHFGDREFRVVRGVSQRGPVATIEVNLGASNLPHELVTGLAELDDLLDQGSVEPHLQPLVDLQDESVIGWELLGRGAHSGLPVSPYELFRVAAAAGKEVALSRVFRDVGVRGAQQVVGNRLLFVNTHPTELRDVDGLLGSLRELRTSVPTVRLVLEVHEGAVVGPAPMRRLEAGLRELDMGLAYDDFGAGQARLVELLSVPPRYMKFDIAIVRGLHEASESKRAMIVSLVDMLKAQGVRCLAEGVETAEEAGACRDVGFDLAQGWHFGKPAPITG
jgi:EAL domain-containing protein (putative c-di-GMP-specific phosphodiesterase class I)